MLNDKHELSLTDYAGMFNCYGPPIFTYLRLHTSSREEAEDLTLDVFMAALGNPQLLTWSGPRQLGWLKRVATNKLIDGCRRANRRPVIALDQVAETLLDEQDPEFVTLRREGNVQLHQHIQRLSPLQQQLLRLRYGHGLQTAEIAALLNKSESAIRQLLSRTIRSLRTLYEITPSSIRKGADE